MEIFFVVSLSFPTKLLHLYTAIMRKWTMQKKKKEKKTKSAWRRIENSAVTFRFSGNLNKVKKNFALIINFVNFKFYLKLILWKIVFTCLNIILYTNVQMKEKKIRLFER